MTNHTPQSTKEPITQTLTSNKALATEETGRKLKVM